MAETDRLRIAVFIDFDNIEIGVKNTLGTSFDAGLVLEALKERGEVLSKMAYSDWQRAGTYSRLLTQHAIRMVQRNLTPGGDKNGADINLALDALEMAFTHSHINAFVIVGGDSDFISLVEKLKQYGKKVFIVGGRQFTSGILQRNCHEFIAYENLTTTTTGATSATPGVRRQPSRDRAPIEQAVPLVMRGLKVLSEREVSPQLGLLKSTLLQLDSTFSERTYGAGSFRDFVQKLEKTGVVKVHHGKGGLLVEMAEAGAGAPPSADRPATGEELDEQAMPAEPLAIDEAKSVTPPPASRQPVASPAPPVTGTNADGLRELRRILSTAVVRRWPMYLRNVKQILRQTDATFDERAYGFGNLTDLLRAAHREAIVRVDRDRQGVIRVFQGGAVMTAPTSAAQDTGDVDDVDAIDQTQEQPSEMTDDVAVAAAAAEIGVPVMGIEETGDAESPVDVEVVAEEAAPVKRKRPRSRTPSKSEPTRSRRPRKAS